MVVVTLLVCVFILNVAQNAYSALEPLITEDEKLERDEEIFKLGGCTPPSKELLERPVAEAESEHIDTTACVFSTAMASNIKSTNKMMSEIRQSGDVKQEHEKQEVPSGSSCSQTDEKVMANQAGNGAMTEGYTEGKDGAETTANQPGSPAKYALLTQNLGICYAQTIKEMTSVAVSFNSYCKENPDVCGDSTTTSWLAPIAVVQASVGLVNFSTFHQERINEGNASLKYVSKIEQRANQEFSNFARFNPSEELNKAFDDKALEMKVNTATMAEATVGKNPKEGRVEKFEQGGNSHTANQL